MCSSKCSLRITLIIDSFILASTIDIDFPLIHCVNRQAYCSVCVQWQQLQHNRHTPSIVSKHFCVSALLIKSQQLLKIFSSFLKLQTLSAETQHR